MQHFDITPEEVASEFRRLSHKAWLDIIRIFDGPTYECHQRFSVFINCFIYGLSYDKSFDCALTCNNLPKGAFEVRKNG